MGLWAVFCASLNDTFCCQCLLCLRHARATGTFLFARFGAYLKEVEFYQCSGYDAIPLPNLPPLSPLSTSNDLSPHPPHLDGSSWVPCNFSGLLALFSEFCLAQRKVGCSWVSPGYGLFSVKCSVFRESACCLDVELFVRSEFMFPYCSKWGDLVCAFF